MAKPKKKKGGKMNSNKMRAHLQEHIEYPATKKQILDACGKMSDVSPEERERIEKELPDKTFKSADEVMKALKM